MLEPTLGRHSVLTLDDEEHLRQRRVLLPPFHGRAVPRYGEVMRLTARRDMERRPVGRPFALRPHTQAVTLEVILRAVFGLGELKVILREVLERADLRAAGTRDERVMLRNITLAPARGGRMVSERPLRPARASAAEAVSAAAARR